MRIPIIRGVMDRRILVNFRIDAAVMSRNLPPPFRPKRAHEFAIGGICLIRLKHVRPRFIPAPFGIRSENAAHRIAVEWNADGRTREGVFIPRRDTDSRLNALAGGSIFPGVHQHATFTVEEANDRFSVELRSDDGATRVAVSGMLAAHLPESSVFASVDEASDFFEAGAIGYSATRTPDRYDGLELRCDNWRVAPFSIDKVQSSFFEDAARFPPGSVEFDCALLMRGVEHEWHGREDLCCPATAGGAP